MSALQIHRELAAVASMHDEGLEVHTASPLQHVLNGANGGSCCHRDCIQLHSSLGESNLIAQTAAARPQALLGLDLCSPLESFSSPLTQCQAQARTCQQLPSPHLKECFDCVSRWVLRYLHPDLFIF